MKKHIISFSLIFFVFGGGQIMAQDANYNIGVRWAVNGMPSALSLHGVLQSFSGDPQHLDALRPISQYIRQGENSVQLDVWPLEYEPESELRLSLLYWAPGENPNTEARTAFEVVMKPGLENSAPEIVDHDPSAPLQPRQEDIHFILDDEFDTLEVSFDNHQPMPTWCWEQGDELRDSDAIRDSLAEEYRRLYALFEAKDNDAIMEESSTMIQELALASGEPEGYVRHRAGFTVFFDNPDLFQLNPFPEEPMTLNLGADNRVAWLTTRGVNVPIRFNHIQEDGFSSKVYLYFVRRDGIWEICR